MTVSRLPLLTVFLAAGLVASCSQSTTSPDPASASGGTGQASDGTAKPRPDAAQAKGQVSGLTGSCPNLTFTLDGTVVHTNGSTQFLGGSCGDVANGGLAGAAGKHQDDGSILAKVVKVGRPDRPEPPPKPEPPFAAGPIADLHGACPALEFHIGRKPVSTDGATVFEGKACADLANGTPVRVAGSIVSGRLLAARVDSRPKK